MKVIKMTDTSPVPHLDDEGAIGRFLARIFGRSYRTTLAGLASGAGLLIAKDSRVSGSPR